MCAGVYTSSYLLQYLAHLLEGAGCLERLEGFATRFGRMFYGLEALKRRVRLVREDTHVAESLTFVEDGLQEEIVPFLAGQSLRWRLDE